MKLFYPIIVCMATLFVSCNNNKPAPENKPAEIPKVLQDNSSEAELSYSLKKRAPAGDLVEDLYNELLEKDAALSNLEHSIEKIKTDSKDSVIAFNDFDSKNNSYYDSYGRHLNEIKDSVLKNRVKQLLDNSLAKYKTHIAAHNNLIAAIAGKDITLDDLHVILKLNKTLAMIEQYQSGSLPALKPLVSIDKTYDKLLEKTEALGKQ